MENAKNRVSLYFSKRKDADIVSFLQLDSIDEGDINWIVKNLLRDGIKYRNMNNTNNGHVSVNKIHLTPKKIN